jgi:hypothetical protein
LNHLGIQHLLLDPKEMWPSTAKRMAVGLRMMLFLDAVTIYLALLRATDPMEIPKITQLKIATAKT